MERRHAAPAQAGRGPEAVGVGGGVVLPGLHDRGWAGLLGHDQDDCVGDLGEADRRPVPGSQPLRPADPLLRHREQAAGGDDHVTADDHRPVMERRVGEEDRLQELGSQLAVDPDPGGGVVLEADLPLEHHQRPRLPRAQPPGGADRLGDAPIAGLGVALGGRDVQVAQPTHRVQGPAGPGPGSIVFADRRGAMRVWNRSAETIFGYSAAEGVGGNLDVIIPERFRAAHRKGFERAIDTGATKYGGRVLTTRSIRKDGRKLYLDLSFSILTDPAGQATGAVAIARDCTDNHLANAKQMR